MRIKKEVELKQNYNGNDLLPLAGTKKSFTSDQLDELLKCEEDPIYFAEKYFKIVHQDLGLIPLKLFEYQKDAIIKSKNNRNFVMGASRQCGKTTVATAIILHAAIFNKHKNIALLANKMSTAQEILERVKTAYMYLPDFIKGGIKKWSERTIVFENGSKIIADASQGNSIRGKSIFLLYVDECAFIENWDDFARSVLPTISSGTTTRMIFTSTPHGLNHFYYYLKSAKENKSDFAWSEVPWWEVPGRDEKWRIKALDDLKGDQQAFEVEYCVSFIGSSGTLISGAALKLLTPVQAIIENEFMQQFEEKIGNHSYVMTVDTSRGKGLDYSAFQVIDVTTLPYRQVCVYRNNMMLPTDFAVVCQTMATYYNFAQVLVELNDLGQQVVDTMFDDEYENILYTESKGRLGKQISLRGSKGVDRGIRTTTTVKALGCAILKILIEQNKLQIIDKFTISELNTFSAKGKSYEAEQGHHDDMVMCLVLFAWLSDQQYFKELTDLDLSKVLGERTMEQLEADLLPFGLIFDGREEIFQPIIENPNWDW